MADYWSDKRPDPEQIGHPLGARFHGARPKLADFCSATMAEFYSAVDIRSALERAAEREREAEWHIRATPIPEAATARAEALLIDRLRRMAERIWTDQRNKQAARRAFRQKVASQVGSRVFPDAITRHVEDVSTIVFRRTRSSAGDVTNQG